MNRAGLAFSVHDGNIGADPDACSDRFYADTRELFARFDAPLVYTPGENEWLACRTEGMDPPERLAALRRTFFSSDEGRGSAPLRLERQTPGYPENARWRYGDVTFATLHVVGSHDDLDAPEYAPAGPPPSTGWSRPSTGRSVTAAPASCSSGRPTPSSSRTSRPTTGCAAPCERRPWRSRNPSSSSTATAAASESTNR